MSSRLAVARAEAVDIDDAPSVVRFAKGGVCPDIPAIERVGTTEVLSRDAENDVLIVAVGAFGHLGTHAADLLRENGLGVTVVDPRWVKPIDPQLVDMAAQHRLVVTVEDNGVQGGVGSAFTAAVRAAGHDVPIVVRGVEQQFLDHAKRDVILERMGLTPRGVADAALAALGKE